MMRVHRNAKQTEKIRVYEGSSGRHRVDEGVPDITSARLRGFRLRIEPDPAATFAILGDRLAFTKSHLAFLVILSLCLTGNYFAYELPAALNCQMKAALSSGPELWQIQLATLYSAYSLPNIFLPFFTAHYVDVLGSRFTLILFSSFVVFGQYLTALGLENRDFKLMVVGRLLLGIGGESIGISQARIACRWFQGQEARLSFVLSVNLGVARLGSVLSYVLSPLLAARLVPGDLLLGTTLTVWVGFGCCVGSAICAVVVVCIDLLSQRQPNLAPQGAFDQVTSPLLFHGIKPPTYGTGRSELGGRIGRRAALPSAWITGAEPDMHGIDGEAGSDTRSINLLSGVYQMNNAASLPPKEVAGGFGTHYWCICAVIICYYGSVIPFTNVASDFLQQRWYSNQPNVAGMLLAIPDLLSTLLVPAFGSLLGGFERFWATCAAGIGVGLVHGILAFWRATPVWLMTGLGLSYALLAASLWPLIPAVVSEQHLFAAYRTSTCLLNAILALGPLAAALLINLDPSYVVLELSLSGLGFTGALAAVMLLWLVYRSETYMIPSEQEEAIADDYESVEEEPDLDFSNKDDLDFEPLQSTFTPNSSLGFAHSPSSLPCMYPPVSIAGFPGSLLQTGDSGESLLSRQFRALSLSRSTSLRSRLAPRPPRKTSSVLHDDPNPPLDSGSISNPLPNAADPRISWSTFPRPPFQRRCSGLFDFALQSQLEFDSKDSNI